MRILVCGGRKFADYDLLKRTLDEYRRPGLVIIHGCQRGADQLAARWAFESEIVTDPYPAEWKKYGPMAGPIRNQQMIEEGKPDFIIAFVGGVGTADMKERGLKSGLEIKEIV